MMSLLGPPMSQSLTPPSYRKPCLGLILLVVLVCPLEDWHSCPAPPLFQTQWQGCPTQHQAALPFAPAQPPVAPASPLAIGETNGEFSPPPPIGLPVLGWKKA